MAYDIYERTIAAPRWAKLAAAGARPQRLLWASTGTKDPTLPGHLLRRCADRARTPSNTVPPATLDAFLDHGKPAARIKDDLDGAKNDGGGVRGGRPRPVARLPRPARRRREVVHHVDEDAARRGRRPARRPARVRLGPPEARRCRTELQQATDALVAKLAKDRALARIWEADAKLFTSDASHERSIKSRLGWLRAPALMQSKRAELEAFAADVKAGGYTDVVLLGMGGSSLWPEVVSVVWRAAGGPALHVLDNTDPAAVARWTALIGGRKTLFVVASKSGGTIEIQAFERHFWQKTLARTGNDVAKAGANFVAITDPATRLGQLAEEKHYRRVFINPADIGGRYSALSYFGMVPAALVGTDIGALIGAGVEFAAASGAAVPVAESPASCWARRSARRTRQAATS